MDRHFSTLELVKHDETASAPERDYDATAFELDATALAPQVVPDTTPQVLYNTSLPEAHEESTKEKAPSYQTIKPALKWPWMVIALVIAAAIAIGVSVGIWRHREHSSHRSSTAYRCGFFFSLANGDRQLFFQENTGVIRRAIYTASNNQWNTSPYLNASTNSFLNFSSNPKTHTPLAVAIIEDPSDLRIESVIELYYVSQNNSLWSSIFNQGVWTLDSSLNTYSTTVDTRSLSITPIGNGSSDANPTTNSALLYYENSNGNVSALLRRGSFVDQFQWVDITSQQSESLPNEFGNAPGLNAHSDTNIPEEISGDYFNDSKTLYESDTDAIFSTPFTSGANLSGPFIGALFYSPPEPSLVNGKFPLSSGSFTYAGYSIGPGGPGYFGSGPTSAIVDKSSIHQSDVAIFGTDSSPNAIWINGTQPAICGLVAEPPIQGTPNNTFPFKRLTSVITDQSTFLYHQINGTTFAEEQWDASLSVWIPSVYITVSDT
ncbi:MAG: hypothetical protein Q9161_001148 [Pseudevernia consocians]